MGSCGWVNAHFPGALGIFNAQSEGGMRSPTSTPAEISGG